MRIDDNAEALAMMKRALGSLESKFREAYNKGYRDGVKEGVNQATQEIMEYTYGMLTAEKFGLQHKIKSMVAEDEPNSSEKPNNCEPQTTMSCYGCKHRPMGADICDDPCHCHYEPQTDDLIKQADDLIAFEKEWLEMDEPQTETHDKHTETHECVKDTHDKDEPNCSENPNNCENEPTQDQHVQRVEYVENDEKSRCRKCRHFKSEHHTPIASDGHYYTYMVCMASECNYEPKTEPQTERCPHCGDGVITKGQTTCPICGEPIEQTDCAWK